MATYVPLVSVIPQLLDDNANLLSGGKLKFYDAGTTTPTTVYSDASGTALGTEVTLDSDGQPQTAGGAKTLVWLQTGQNYKIEAVDSAGATVWGPFDDIPPFFSDTTGVIATGSTEPRTLADRFADVVNVKDFGAVLDGATDDTEAITACVARAFSLGGAVDWGSKGDTAMPTASIANLHDVIHVGYAKIQRGPDLFVINPKQSQTNTLYADPAGDDANDGLSASQPVRQIQRFFDILNGYGPVLRGKWELELAAGSYDHATLDSGLRSEYPIEINGPVAGHPNVPTAIIDGTASPSESGIKITVDGWVRLTDIFIKNFSSGNAAECNASRLSLTNVHTDSCLTSVSNILGGFVSVKGGLWDGKSLVNSAGYRGLFNAKHDFKQSSLAEALTITNFARGMLIDEGTQGHLDLVKVHDCTIGLNFKRGAGACNTSRMQLYRNSVGVLAENNGWYNNGIDFGTGANANTVNVRALGVSPELILATATTQARNISLLESTSVATHTGTTAETNLYQSASIPDWVVAEEGHFARLIIFGEAALAAPAALRSYINAGSDDTIAVVNAPIGTYDFKLEVVIYYSTSNSQRAVATLVGQGVDTQVDFELGTSGLKNSAHTIKQNVVLGASGDSIKFRAIHLEATFAG